ncbi:MAG: hypothetical protein H6713_25090 [Myxococcales bacterium]|nr:hypothetical protein [Myxococcales bacterium]
MIASQPRLPTRVRWIVALALGHATLACGGDSSTTETDSDGAQLSCGDGVLDPDEECDAGPAGDERCATDCSKRSRLVFISSSVQTGDLGGLAGADAICQGLAEANELPGEFMAWLSDDTSSPSTRFVKSTVPYLLLNTRNEETWLVADSYDELIDGELDRRILIDETGEAAFLPTDTWTNTRADGTPVDENTSCQNWTASGGASGMVGDADQLSQTWTQNTATSCSQYFHLYCFEQ